MELPIMPGSPFFLLSLMLLLFPMLGCSSLETYLVHAPKSAMPSQHFAATKDWHSHLVKAVVSSAEEAKQRLLYSYDAVMHGFAASLSEHEVAMLRAQEGVSLAVKMSNLARPHTTRTPEFLGLDSSSASLFNTSYGSSSPLWQAGKKGDGVIVGVLDTGVWPAGRRSFADDGFTDVPARWKGTCESSDTFNASSLCNRKLIGARTFYKGYEASNGPINETLESKSPLDGEGHGTHTSSTAVGNSVVGASLLGLANGTASGMAPLARLAMYKVCWVGGCFDADLLAAFEAAITDGVDVISLSVGGPPGDYFGDNIAIGAFAAAAHGIVTSCSAGNSGPDLYTASNLAPWIFTIAASSVDRDFPAPAVLGNGKTYRGLSLYSGPGLEGKQLPLIYAGDAALPGANASMASVCVDGFLDAGLVKDKLVFCDRGVNGRAEKGFVVSALGAAGMIVGNTEANGEELVGDSHILPATQVGAAAAQAIRAYIEGTGSPTATLQFEGTKLGVKPAPVMAAFSSRGPNVVTPEILKPDVTAPGVNILAAWTAAVGPTSVEGDTRDVEFNVISGTSMSCPHVAGITALLRAAYPHWSPAAIRSAIMTSAVTLDNTGSPLTDSATGNATWLPVYGAGHVHPNAALYPGLVYDISPQDYFDFLCSLDYTPSQLSVFALGKYACSSTSKISTPLDLNYPSFSFAYNQSLVGPSFSATVSRTLTNVGPPNSTYTASALFPSYSPYFNVSIQPSSLVFHSQYQKLSYTLSVQAAAPSAPDYAEFALPGSITWSDATHSVNSPLLFMWLV